MASTSAHFLVSGGRRVGGARGKAEMGPLDDGVILSQP